MSVVGTATKQPGDVQDYDIEFGEWFPTDDVIVAVSVTASPSMPISPSHSISPNGKRVKVWVYAGGVNGATHKLTVRATTNDGRIKEVELKVKIKEV